MPANWVRYPSFIILLRAIALTPLIGAHGAKDHCITGVYFVASRMAPPFVTERDVTKFARLILRESHSISAQGRVEMRENRVFVASFGGEFVCALCRES